jgi:hypothetical protein
LGLNCSQQLDHGGIEHSNTLAPFENGASRFFTVLLNDLLRYGVTPLVVRRHTGHHLEVEIVLDGVRVDGTSWEIESLFNRERLIVVPKSQYAIEVEDDGPYGNITLLGSTHCLLSVRGGESDVTVAFSDDGPQPYTREVKLSTVVLPSERWPENRAKWLRAEELGFHAAYTYDHLSWRSFRERTWMSMVPLLAAVSEATSTIRLGPLVTSPNFRHPLLLAKDLITLDDVSNGRLTVGVGAGGRGFDAEVFGDTPWTNRERHERFVEFTNALDTLLRENASTIDGAFYPVVDSRQLPGPVQRPRPPLLVSALGPKSISFAARIGDGWICVGGLVESNMTTEEVVREQSNKLDSELSGFGRSGDAFERLFLDGFNDESPLSSFESFVDWAGRYHALGFTELVIHYPVVDSPFDVDQSLFERIATDGREAIVAWH